MSASGLQTHDACPERPDSSLQSTSYHLSTRMTKKVSRFLFPGPNQSPIFHGTPCVVAWAAGPQKPLSCQVTISLAPCVAGRGRQEVQVSKCDDFLETSRCNCVARFGGTQGCRFCVPLVLPCRRTWAKANGGTLEGPTRIKDETVEQTGWSPTKEIAHEFRNERMADTTT